MIDAGLESSSRHSKEYDVLVEDIRTRLASGDTLSYFRFEDWLRRKFGIAPLRAGAAVFVGLVGVGIRLGLALAATTLVGEWADIPWVRWTVILAFFAVVDVVTPLMNRPLDMASSPAARQLVEVWSALLPTVERKSDLRDLVEFTRRLSRLTVSLAAGMVVTVVMLVGCWLFTPPALGGVPIGSIVLLVFLLEEFGEGVVFGNYQQSAFIIHEARYDHHLFWPSPADSPQVKSALKGGTRHGFITGIWITFYLALAVWLVSWGSPLVLPLAVGFIVIGYLTTISVALINRASIQKIVERSRERWLTVLQDRIDGFGRPVPDLSHEESARLRESIDLHNLIRDAPSTPTTTRTLIHTAVGLIIPTL
ncbi:MAG: hypothetical protein ABFR53_11210, partial [Actinomycetota bacterium]